MRRGSHSREKNPERMNLQRGRSRRWKWQSGLGQNGGAVAARFSRTPQRMANARPPAISRARRNHCALSNVERAFTPGRSSRRSPMWVAVLINLLAALSTPTPAAPAAVHYTLAPVLSGDSLTAMAVEIRFAGDEDGETTLELPNAWGGTTALYEGIRDLAVSGKDATLLSGDEPARRTIRHAAGAEVTVRYKVVQLWAGEPVFTGANEYRPVIQPRYFHLIGEGVFVKPARPMETPATFEWAGGPRGWTFASDLEHAAATGRPLRIGEVMESITVGGDFRVTRKGPIRVAIRGDWAFTDSVFIARLEPILSSHYRFWGEPPQPYLVSVLPSRGPENVRSAGGTGR